MLVGYNTNISYKDKIYHVQTEDSGKNNPVIVSLLYSKGAILASKKTSYAHVIGHPDLNDKVRNLMKIQHKSMIKELLAGKYTVESAVAGDATLNDQPSAFHGELPESTSVQEEVMAEISENTLEKPDQKTEPDEQLTRSLDDILLNFILKRAKKK